MWHAEVKRPVSGCNLRTHLEGATGFVQSLQTLANHQRAAPKQPLSEAWTAAAAPGIQEHKFWTLPI